MSEPSNIVAIGDGAAGVAFAGELRRLVPDARITLLSDDPHATYHRAALTNFLLGRLMQTDLPSVPAGWMGRMRVGRRHARVLEVDAPKRRLVLEGHEHLPYDHLLLATGARPARLRVPGEELEGVVALRSMAQAVRLARNLSAGAIKHAAVVGGGPLGLELLQALVHKKVGAKLVLRRPRVMERELGEEASARVLATVAQHLVLGQVTRVVQRKGRLCLELTEGEVPDLDLVLVAVGIESNAELLGAGSEGVEVDGFMRTPLDGVLAAGDVAQVYGRRLGLWGPARRQGQVAARWLAATLTDLPPADPLPREPHYLATRLFDKEVAAARLSPFPEGKEEVVEHTVRGGYRRIQLVGHSVVGFELLGSPEVRAWGRTLHRIMTAGESLEPVLERLRNDGVHLPTWWAQQQRPHRAEALKAGHSVPEILEDRGRGPVQPTPVAEHSGLALWLTLPGEQAVVGPVRSATLGRDSGQCDVVIAEGVGHDRVSRKHVSLAVDQVLKVTHHSKTNSTVVIGGAGLVTELRQPDEQWSHQGVGAWELNLGGKCPVKVQVTREADPAVVLAGPAPRSLASGELITPGVQVVVEDGIPFVRNVGELGDLLVNDVEVTGSRRLHPGDRIRTDTGAWQVPPLPVVQDQAGPTGDLQHTPVPSPASSGVRLRVWEGAQQRTVEVHTESVLGRDPARCHVLLGDPEVSGRHARLAVHPDGTLVVEDLGSTNGTEVNGRRIVPGTPRPLAVGDEVVLGRVRVVVEVTP